MTLPKRIQIFGNAGSGKSTLASRVGNALNLPVFHLDKHYWLSGWIERPLEEMIADVKGILDNNESWVIDGNFKRSLLGERMERADLIIMLEVNRFVCLYRVFKRALKYRKETRSDMKEGCHERVTWQFIKFILNYRKRTLSRLQPFLDKHPQKIVRLRNGNNINQWLSTLPHKRIF
jgi:adenylate kinase family enzyme